MFGGQAEPGGDLGIGDPSARSLPHDLAHSLPVRSHQRPRWLAQPRIHNVAGGELSLGTDIGTDRPGRRTLSGHGWGQPRSPGRAGHFRAEGPAPAGGLRPPGGRTRTRVDVLPGLPGVGMDPPPVRPRSRAGHPQEHRGTDRPQPPCDRRRHMGEAVVGRAQRRSRGLPDQHLRAVLSDRTDPRGHPDLAVQRPAQRRDSPPPHGAGRRLLAGRPHPQDRHLLGRGPTPRTTPRPANSPSRPRTRSSPPECPRL